MSKTDGAPTHKSSKTKIEGVRIIQRPIHKDECGQTASLFHVKHSLAGVPEDFEQELSTLDMIGSLRGMHFQKDQGKLVTCVLGAVCSVWIDLRPKSKTYLKSEVIQLDSEGMSSVYLPPMVAHGYIVLSKFASVQVKLTKSMTSEAKAFRWDSKELSDCWPDDIAPILSDKDRFSLPLDEFLRTLS